jgi:large subunit ribosomal protein L29
MKFAELKNKSEKELKEMIWEKQEEMHQTRFKASEGQLKNPSVIKKIRRTIAQLVTLVNRKKSVDIAQKIKTDEEKKV